MNIRKVLWATDGSEESNYALKYAKLFAKTFDGEIIGLHVLKTVNKNILNIIGNRLDMKSLIQQESSRWSNKFDATRNELKKEKLRFSKAIVEAGLSHEKIIQVATREKADLIVMGKRGIGLKDKKHIGSNTLKVLQGSQIPVLAVRRGTTKSLPKIRKIMVPFDISEKFSSALDKAISLSNKLAAKLTVIYVEELVSYPYEFPVSIINEIRDIHGKELQNKINEVCTHKEIKLKIKHKVVESITPYLGIIRFAEEDKSDLIVMNTHARKGLKKLVLGSVAEKIINEAPCSILALRP